MKLAALVLVALHLNAYGERSMKGWEIYSWFDATCSAKPHVKSAPNPDSVCFALLPGTNRRKTVEEIRKAPLPIAALAQRIATLHPGDEVFWNAPDETFDVPDAARGRHDPRNQAVVALRKSGAKLTVTRGP
jgi:hypothetical protein